MNRKRSVNSEILNNYPTSAFFNQDLNSLDCIGPVLERKECDAGILKTFVNSNKKKYNKFF